MSNDIPVTVFTGYLGSGKTTLILSLLKQVPADYKVALLKNEYGNLSVDSKLTSANLTGVTEILNGCLCCTFVGKVSGAVNELIELYGPHRIIIETSGTAFPATMALEIKRLEGVVLDGLITVVDSENFIQHADTSVAAKMAAQFSDLIVMNKVECVDENRYDRALDGVLELNDETPIVRAINGVLDIEVAFGLDRHWHELPETVHDEVDLLHVSTDRVIEVKEMEDFLQQLKKDIVFRMKGFLIVNETESLILNYAFGRWNWTSVNAQNKTQFTIVLQQGEGRRVVELLRTLSLQ